LPEPATVLALDKITLNVVNSTLERFEREDDVFTPAFTSLLLFVTGAKYDAVPEDLDQYLRTLGTRYVGFLHQDKQSQDQALRPGPYLANPSGLIPAWRLYADHFGAFVRATVPLPTNTNQSVQCFCPH
jgi:hypothetical protein